jgi:hypothetical protein
MDNRYKFKASTLYNLQPAHERKKYVKALTGEPISTRGVNSTVRSNFSGTQTTGGFISRERTPDPRLVPQTPND